MYVVNIQLHTHLGHYKHTQSVTAPETINQWTSTIMIGDWNVKLEQGMRDALPDQQTCLHNVYYISTSGPSVRKILTGTNGVLHAEERAIRFRSRQKCGQLRKVILPVH